MIRGDDVLVLPTAQAVAEAAAERFREAALDAVAERGRFVVVLSGGSTPRLLYRSLVASEDAPTLPWPRTHVFFGDERGVGPDHRESNYRMARETFLDPVGIPKEQIHRIRGELADLDIAATEYEATLRGLYAREAQPRFDLLLLGIGDDGHTASLFPGTTALDERERWVVENHVPRLGAWRVTMTFPALCAARRILFMITGASKAQVVAEAFGALPHEGVYPCERVIPVSGTREVLLDREAAARLP